LQRRKFNEFVQRQTTCGDVITDEEAGVHAPGENEHSPKTEMYEYQEFLGPDFIQQSLKHNPFILTNA